MHVRDKLAQLLKVSWGMPAVELFRLTSPQLGFPEPQTFELNNKFQEHALYCRLKREKENRNDSFRCILIFAGPPQIAL